jgi:hypothetical protein
MFSDQNNCMCWLPPQVLQLRADIAMLQATNSQANALAAAEVDSALSSVS